MGVRRSVTFTPQSDAMIERLIEYGIYGRTFGEVIRRLVDAKLTEFCVPMKMRLTEIQAEISDED